MNEISVERKELLLRMWTQIRTWVGTNCRFTDTKRFDFPHEVYHWSAFEVYPNGECAVLTGSHGNPGDHRPTMIVGYEEFWFCMADNCPSWYGNYTDLERYRDNKTVGVTHHARITRYRLLDELFRNWDHIKSKVEGEIASDRKLKEFTP